MLQSLDNEYAAPEQSTSVRWRPQPSPEAIAALQQLDCLSKLPVAELARLVPLCVVRACEVGETISSERSVGRTLMIILSGSVSLSQDDSFGHHVLLSLLGRGDLFGEGGLFGLRYRRVTALAETRVTLLQLGYEELKLLLPDLPVFTGHLRRSYRERLLQTTLARVPLLSGLTAIERMALAAELDEQQFERGATVASPGDTPIALGQALHIIAEGQAAVVREGHQVAILQPGDFFGEMELLEVGASVASIVAITPLHLLALPATTFAELLRDHPMIADGMRELMHKRLEEGHSEAYVAVTEAAIGAGVMRGRRFLARTPALCPPGCNLCEQACANRHGVARIHLNGTTFGSFDVPRGCMHCVWSPECSDACPVDALQLADNGMLFVNDRCTGCGACVEACPYDAVTMIPLYPPALSARDWMLRLVRRPEPIRMDAHICDGCHAYADQACLRACPTGSLRWATLEELYEQGADVSPLTPVSP